MTARQAVPAPSPFEIWKTVITQKYAEFNGRARRAEYWWFVIINALIALAASLLYIPSLGGGDEFRFGFLGGMVTFGLVVFWLAMIIPSIAVAVRRLHDTNKSGWMIFISLIPFIGGLILLVFMLIDGDVGDNQYGPSPKYAEVGTPETPAV